MLKLLKVYIIYLDVLEKKHGVYVIEYQLVMIENGKLRYSNAIISLITKGQRAWSTGQRAHFDSASVALDTSLLSA